MDIRRFRLAPSKVPISINFLPNIRYHTRSNFDNYFRDNAFESLSPFVLYSNHTPWQLVGTKVMQGMYFIHVLYSNHTPWQLVGTKVMQGM